MKILSITLTLALLLMSNVLWAASTSTAELPLTCMTMDGSSCIDSADEQEYLDDFYKKKAAETVNALQTITTAPDAALTTNNLKMIHTDQPTIYSGTVPAYIPMTARVTTEATIHNAELDTTLGWSPSAIANVSAFYLNGNYRLLSGGFAGGAAYTWQHGRNINAAGVYLGPQSEQVNGETRTGLTLMAYLDLFKTSVGQFGIGLGTELWRSGKGLQAPDRNNTFLAAAYKF